MLLILSHFNSFVVHIHSTSEMTVWFYARFDDVTAPRVFQPAPLGLHSENAEMSHTRCSRATRRVRHARLVELDVGRLNTDVATAATPTTLA